MGQRKNSESPWGIKPQNFGFCSLILYHWATGTLWWVTSITKKSIMKLLPRFLMGTQNFFFVLHSWKLTQKHLPIVQSGSYCGKKRKQLMWTHVFLTDCILRNDAVNSMSFFYLRKAWDYFHLQKCHWPI